MMATADMADIAAYAATSGHKVIAAGDQQQLPAVEGGGAMNLLSDQLGYVQLAEAMRFTQQWEREASLALRRGEMEALEDYDPHGRIMGDEPELALDLARSAYLGSYLARRDVLMIARAHETCSELSRRVRDDLVHLGLVDNIRAVELRDGARAGAGDVIVARRNDHDLEAGEAERGSLARPGPTVPQCHPPAATTANAPTPAPARVRARTRARLRPAPWPLSRRRAQPGRRAGCAPDGQARDGSRVHCDSLTEGGARLCPSGLATGTPQTFPAASRSPASRLPEVPRRNQPAGTRRSRPSSTRFEPVRALRGFKTPVPRVLLSGLLAGHTPSGSTNAARLCQDCSHPARRLPGKAVLSSRQGRCDGPAVKVSHLHSNQQRLTAHEARDQRLRHHPRRPVPGRRGLLSQPPETPLVR